MKRALFVMGVVFAATLAIIFGTRVSPDALGIVIGVILGVAAGVPTTLLAVFILTRSPRHDSERYPGAGLPQSPPVVIVTGQGPPQPYPSSPPPALSAAPSRRSFTIIGDEGTE